MRDLRFVLVELFLNRLISCDLVKELLFPQGCSFYAVYFYLRYTLSYRDMEEIMAQRGVRVDHATLNRRVLKYSLIVAARAQSKKRPTLSSWRMDETYLRVLGEWMFLYRAVDKAGNTLDFMLSARRNRPAARFFAKALSSNGTPSKIVIDKSGAKPLGETLIWRNR